MRFDIEDNTIAYAKKLVMNKFVGIVDKGGNDYYIHCFTVGKSAYHVGKVLFKDEMRAKRCELVGILHDIVEDTDVTVEDIENLFGKHVAELVDNVTKRPGESRDSYHNRVFSSKYSMIVKFADSNHNSQINRIPNPKEFHIKKCAKYAKFNTELGEKLGLH